MNLAFIKRLWFLHVIAVIMILLSHVYTIFYFPPTEGWWQTYAYLYNAHPEYYKGLHIAFPPLFVLIDSWLMRFSDLYIVYRLLGVAWVIMLYAVLYVSVRRYYEGRVAVLSALFAILISVYNNAYFPNDYHTVVYIFVVISLLLYQLFQNKERSFIERIIISLLLAISTMAALFVKQNIGAVLIVATVIGACLPVVTKYAGRELLLNSLYLIFLIFSYFVFVRVLGMDKMDIYRLTFGNDSKGGGLTVLLRILLDDGSRGYLIKGLWYFLLFAFFEYVGDRYLSSKEVYLKAVNYIVFALLAVIFFRDPQGSSVILCVIYIYYLVYNWLIKGKYDVLLLPLIALVYANSMTAGLCVGGVFIIMPYAIGFYFNKIGDNQIADYLRYGFITLLFFALFMYKQKEPYNWWGLKQSQILQAKYELPYRELRGFKVDKSTQKIFLDIKNEIDSKSLSSDDVYLFPHIPIFYHLHKKVPVTNNLVQWFDVISTNHIKEELDIIKNINPRVVVILNPPWFVFKGHSALKNSRLYQQDIIKYFETGVAYGRYKLVKYQIYDNDIYGDNINDYDVIEFKVKVNSPYINGHTLDELYDGGYLNDHYDIYDIVSNSYHVKDIRMHRLRSGDLLSAFMRYSQINEFVCKMGAPDISSNDRYVLRIYERIDADSIK